MNNILFSILTILLLASAGFINTFTEKPSLVISKQESAININNDFLGVFSMGQKRLLADIFWIMTLLESDIDHYKNRDLNSWLYLRFKTIVDLDPKFYNAYLFGGQYLDIVKDDLIGAKDIYLKGLNKFPNDYDMNFRAGFLFAHELKDYKIAIPIYEKLVTFPQTPNYFISILNKMKLQAGVLTKEDTFKSLLEIFKKLDSVKSKILYDRVKADLYALKAEIDLECLNQKSLEDCESKDFEGNNYIFTKGLFQSIKEVAPYKLYNKN